MAIHLSDARRAIESHGFSQVSLTSKVIEYTNKSGRTLYLRSSQGFPSHADIAVHPEADVSELLKIQDVKPHKNVFRYGSNMSQFPERLHTGQKPENYGRAFHVNTAEALAMVCSEYGRS